MEKYLQREANIDNQNRDAQEYSNSSVCTREPPDFEKTCSKSTPGKIQDSVSVVTLEYVTRPATNRSSRFSNCF